MDVVNGKIVPASTERSRSEIWNGLKPSGVSVKDACSKLPAPPSPPWGAAVMGRGGGSTPGAVASSMALEHGTARWQRRPRDVQSLFPQPPKSLLVPAGATGAPTTAITTQGGLVPSSRRRRGSLSDDLDCPEPFRAGWKRNFPEHEQARETPPLSFEEIPVSTLQLSEEGCEIRGATPAVAEAVTVAVAGDVEVSCREGRGVENPAADGGDGVSWTAPLRSLIRKQLTVSDVGELGRIVLPKKDAELQLPLIEARGMQLEMDEYSLRKRWLFQYKCWINNKSRMYILENTREFVKHHGLKVHDDFIVYEDGCGHLVVRGQKNFANEPLVPNPLVP